MMQVEDTVVKQLQDLQGFINLQARFGAIIEPFPNDVGVLFLRVIILTKFAGLLGDKMKSHNKALFAVLAVAMLGIGIPAVAAQSTGLQYSYSAGIATLSTDSLNVMVVGINQSPHFHWWDPNNDSIDYHVRFISLFEANDTDGDGVFTRQVDTVVGPRFMLPTAGWEFSGFETVNESGVVTAVNFNFTSTSEYDPRPGGPMGDYSHLPGLSNFDVMVQIRVHLYASTPNQLKFDVVVDGWNWTYNTSILVLQYTIAESGHGQSMPESTPTGFHKTGTQFHFDNAYMNYESEALSLQAQNSVQVKASYGEGIGNENGESVYLSFGYFGNNTLVYDPVIGISSESSTPLFDTTTLLIVGGIVAVALIVVALKVRK